jgi:soluble lytic murein transglycosylase-like protein
MSMLRQGIGVSLSLAGALLGPATAGADVFRFEDATGIIHYTNIPADPRYRPFQAPPPPPPPAAAPTRPEPAAAPSWTVRFGEFIKAAVERYRVDRRLVEAVITVESAGNPWAVSPKGALGLMQLMPARAAELGVRNALDPKQNIDGGVRHLRDLLQRFTGDVTLALAAYNAGEGAVRQHGGVPPFPETRAYVRKIGGLYSGRGLVDELPEEPPGENGPPPTAPQAIYQETADDGTVTFTNVPPRRGEPGPPRRF